MPNVLSVKQRGHITVVRPQSPFLGYCASERLGKELQFLVDNSAQPNLVLNLDDVQYFGARCLGKLMEFQKSISPKGGTIKFCFAGETMSELFRIVGFDKFFEVYATEEDALESF